MCRAVKTSLHGEMKSAISLATSSSRTSDRHHSRNPPLSALYCILFLFHKNAVALSLTSSCSLRVPCGSSLSNFWSCYHQYGIAKASSTATYAKQPPKSRFDLEKLEAYEAWLETESIRLDNEGAADGEGGEDEELSGDELVTLQIPPALHNTRIDAALAALIEPTLSRSHIGSLIKEGHVHRLPSENSPAKPVVVTKKSLRVEAGQTIRIFDRTSDDPEEINAENIPLDIIYEDTHMVVLNKAAGMVVHPAAGNWNGTVVNALAHYLPFVSMHGAGEFIGNDTSISDKVNDNGDVVFFRPGIVHRLDKGTTGVLVVAKTRQALSALSDAFAKRKVRKTYFAITVGNPGSRVVIDKPIGRHPIHRQKMRVVPNPTKLGSGRTTGTQAIRDGGGSLSQTGRRAVSFLDTKAFDGKLSVVEVHIETGRTHQIRVHLQDRHTPVYGDDVYGIPDWNKKLSRQHGIGRPLLHAYMLELDHPITGERLCLQAPLAQDMTRIADIIWPEGRNERSGLFAAVPESTS